MRRRNVFSKREILASDINEVNDNVIANEKTIIKDLMAVSSGVVSGLNITYSMLDFTVVKGTYSDGEIFYELLNDLTDSLPIAGTYKIYITLGSTDDTPVSGYTLIDTLLRVETYDVVNNRTYDSITVGKTTGTLPVGAIQIGTLISDGTNITSYTDNRIFVTFGNVIAYSLQNFSENSKSTASRAGKISGVIIDETDPLHNVWSKVTVNNAHAGYGHQVITGTNVDAIGFLANINNNIGFKSVSSGTNSIGFNSNIGATNKSFYGLSSSKTATTGLELDGYLNAINLVNSTTGLTITGLNADINEHGIKLIDNYNSLYIENTNFLASGQYLSKTIANADITGGIAPQFANIIQTTGAMAGQKISSNGDSDFSYGTFYENNTTSGSYTGIVFSNGITGSINISMNNPTMGLFIEQSINLGVGIYGSNTYTLSTFDLNKSIQLDLGHNVTGIHITKATPISTASYGMIIGDLIGSANKFENNLYLKNSRANSLLIENFTNNAIKITGVGSGIEYGINLNNVANPIKINQNSNIGGTGIDIVGVSARSMNGIHISNSNESIRIEDINSGIKIYRFNTTGIDIDSNLGVISTGILLNANKDGIIIQNGLSSAGTALTIANYNRGIDINGITNSYAINITSSPNQLKLSNLTTLPPLTASGHIANVNNELRFYNGTSWKTVTMV